MVKRIKKRLQRIWNILNSKDLNNDGKIDIHDKMIEAGEKVNANKKS